MQDIEQALVAFFESVAQKDISLLNKLKLDQSFCVDHERWYFTLPNLYAFLQHENDVFESIDYKQFRQLLFNCPINSSTKQYEAEIIITDNQHKVDKSNYALVWRKK